jgi:hypothetical protein
MECMCVMIEVVLEIKDDINESNFRAKTKEAPF